MVLFCVVVFDSFVGGFRSGISDCGRGGCCGWVLL